MFNHNLLDYHPLDVQQIDGKRFYRTASGRLYQSVTTALSNLNKSKLDSWKEKVGIEAAESIMRKASNRGTKVHALCEQYVLNQSVDGMPIHMEMFRQIKSYLDANVEVVRGVEIPLYSDRLQLAGRCDLVAETKQGLSVIDFKTSSREKREEWILNYYYQATIYSMMVEELYQLDVNHCAIVIAVEDSGLQVFEFDNRQYRDQVIKFVDSFKEEGYD